MLEEFRQHKSQGPLQKDTQHTSFTQSQSGLYPKKSVRIPFTSLSPQDLALVLKEKGSTFNSVSGETEPYSLLLLVSSTRTGTGKDMLRRYSACQRGEEMIIYALKNVHIVSTHQKRATLVVKGLVPMASKIMLRGWSRSPCSLYNPCRGSAG